jgi:DNA-directed RNA polymerase subunit alpha
MELLAQRVIDLFAETLPSLQDLERLSDRVHSSERNILDFSEKLEQNMSRTGSGAVLAVGIGLYIVGRDSEAVDKLQKAKDCKEKFIYLGFALGRLGRFDEAVESLETSLEYGADALRVGLKKAAIYRCSGEFDAAARELAHCKNFVNVSAEYHYQLGRLQEAEGAYEAAMGNYTKAIDLSPRHEEALFRLAYRYDLSGDEEAAVDYYKQVASGPRVHVNALLNLAVLYEDRGEFDKACCCVDRVLNFHPNHARAILFKKDVEGSKTMYYDEEVEKKKDYRIQILETPISDFELSVRSRNCFRKMGIRTLGDLVRITEVELLSYKNFGETSLREIKIILESKGLYLGMGLEVKRPGPEEELAGEAESEDKALLAKPVEDLNLSVRSRKCLEKLNIRTLAELTKKTEAELLGVKNFGVTSLNEIKKAVEGFGLALRTLD